MADTFRANVMMWIGDDGVIRPVPCASKKHVRKYGTRSVLSEHGAHAVVCDAEAGWVAQNGGVDEAQ